MAVRLEKEFYQRDDVNQVARELLGKVLCTHIDNQFTSGMIVETEAYKAPEDKASHAYQNKRTNRTEVMFKNGGHAYVYLCYGIHHMMNVVTSQTDFAHAVLIRAIQPISGVESMMSRRKLNRLESRLTSGPGSTAMALGIKTDFTGLNMLDDNSPIWIEDHQFQLESNQIVSGPRIGVAYAEECALWPWRYYVKSNQWVSKPR